MVVGGCQCAASQEGGGHLQLGLWHKQHKNTILCSFVLRRNACLGICHFCCTISVFTQFKSWFMFLPDKDNETIWWKKLECVVYSGFFSFSLHFWCIPLHSDTTSSETVVGILGQKIKRTSTTVIIIIIINSQSGAVHRLLVTWCVFVSLKSHTDSIVTCLPVH